MRPPAAGEELPRELVDVAKQSFMRCCAAPDFFACFYRNFFRACPEAEPLFVRTNFRRQHKLLRHAIGLLLAFPSQPATEPTILKRVADRHSSRELKIKPSLYAPFVDSLVQTIGEHDPEFDAATEDAWRRTLAPGVAYMQSRYA